MGRYRSLLEAPPEGFPEQILAEQVSRLEEQLDETHVALADALDRRDEVGEQWKRMLSAQQVRLR